MDSIKLILPFPPSVNTAYPTIIKGRKPIRIKSAKLKKWIKDAPEFEERIAEKCLITYLMFFPDERIRDGENYMKVPTDYLVSCGVLQGDDRRYIKGGQWYDGGTDKENPRIEVTIKGIK